MLPAHIFVTYETPANLTICSAVVGYINQMAVVLLVERDDNHLTSITNAIAEVVKAATEPALTLFRRNPPDWSNGVNWFPREAQEIVWLEAYEYRIATDVYTDAAIMRIDVEDESWWPVEAAIAEGLEPFLKAFRSANIKTLRDP